MTEEEFKKQLNNLHREIELSNPFRHLSSKKQEERRAICPMLKEVGIPSERVVCIKEDGTEQEEPDFIINDYDGKCIGVEVVKCVSSKNTINPTNCVEIDSNTQKAVSDYEQLMIKRGELHTHIRISPTLNMYHAPYKQREYIKRFIEEVDRHREIDYIYTGYIKKGDMSLYEQYQQLNDENKFIYELVESIDEFSHDWIDTKVWCERITFPRTIKESDFLPFITSKEDKLTSYKKKSENSNINEYWLVVDVPFVESLSIDDYKQEGVIKSSYDRIYLTGFDDSNRVK